MEQQYKTDAEIYAVLEREIIDLTIRPGSSLSENPLCARFGAPRSLIRVVLQKLQENGLVRIVPYKGTTVTRLNRRIVDELIYERTAVEGRILRDFAPIATPAQRAQIRARVDAYEALARVENPDFNKLYEADCRLHETWFSAMDKMYLWSTPAERPRRLQPFPYAGHHDHRRAGRGDRRPPQPAERHRAVRPCRL